MRPRDVQLFIRHVDAGDMAVRTDEFGEGEYIAPGAAAEIEHFQTVQRRRNGEAAPVVASGHIIMNRSESSRYVRGWAGICRAGVSLQV